MSINGFTITERKMLELLSDGLPHRVEELRPCLFDELSTRTAIQVHICNIRKKLVGKGEDIVCVIRNRATSYQHVRLLASANDGRT